MEAFSELNDHGALARQSLPCCVKQGCDQEPDVVIIYAGESVLEVDRDPVGETGRDPQHPSLADPAIPVHLARVLGSLDHRIQLVTAAITRANG